MRGVTCLALWALFAGIETAGHAAEMAPPPNPLDPVPVTVNSQESLAKAIGDGFEDEAWESPKNLLPRDLPGLAYVSGPEGRATMGSWRQPVAYTQKPTGVTVKVNCFRKREKPLVRGEVGKDTPVNSQPFMPLTEPNYEYKVIEFHDLKAATATAEGREVFIFREGDILFKVEATQGNEEARKNVVRPAAEAIWMFRHAKQQPRENYPHE